MTDNLEERRRTFPAGEVLCGRFRVARLIGRGGMGDVYEADDLELGVTVALKTIRHDISDDPATLRRFKREVTLARHVTHPNVCRVFDLFIHHPPDGGPSKLVLTMELLRGETLARRLGRGGKIPAPKALGIVRDMAEGLAAAHRAGIVHRDLKCGNVFLVPTEDGGERAVLTDFGLACSPGPTHGDDSTATAPERFFGTPAYVSPEQLQGQPTGPASDIYSLGVVMYEMITGSRPFEGPSPMSAAVRRLVEEPTPPRRLVREVDARWQAVILRCLHRDPARRFARVEDVVAALTGEAAHLRLPRRVVAGVAAAAVLATALGVLWWHLQRPRPEGQRPSVAVLGLRDLRQDGHHAWLAPALAEMLATELSADQQLRLVPGQEVARVRTELGLDRVESFTRDTLTNLHRLLGSDYVLVGSYLALDENEPGTIRLDLRVQETDDGSVVASTSVRGSEAQLLDLVSDAGRRMRRQLGLGELSDEALRLARGLLPTSPEATRLYAQGLERLNAMDALAARDLLERAVAAEPGFPLAHAALAAAHADLGYVGQARQEAAEAARLADGLPREARLVVEAQQAAVAADWPRAIDVYRSLWTFFPDNPWYGMRLVEAQLDSGAVAAARETVERLRRSEAAEGPQLDLVAARVSGAAGDTEAQRELAARAAASSLDLGAKLLYARARRVEALALWELGRSEEARRVATEAAVVLEAVGDRQGEAQAAIFLATLDRAARRLDQAREDLHNALDIAAEIGDAGVRATALDALGDLALEEGDLDAAADLFDRALELYRETGNARFEARLLRARASVLRRRGDLQTSLADSVRAFDILDELGDRDAAAAALNSIAIIHKQQGRLDDAAVAFSRALTIKREIGDRRELATPLVNIGNVELARGRLDEAEAAFTEALDLAEEIDSDRHRSYALFGLGEIAAARDDLGAARGFHQRALDVRVASGQLAAAEASRLALALVELDAGNAAVAGELAARVLADAEKSLTPDLECWADAVAARAALGAGDLTRARELADAAAAAVTDDRSALTFVDITVARVEVAEGRPEAAVTRLTSRLDQCTREDLPSARFECLIALGEAQAAAGSTEDAAASLRQARDLAVELGSESSRREAERRLAALGE